MLPEFLLKNFATLVSTSQLQFIGLQNQIILPRAIRFSQNLRDLLIFSFLRLCSHM